MERKSSDWHEKDVERTRRSRLARYGLGAITLAVMPLMLPAILEAKNERPLYAERRPQPPPGSMLETAWLPGPFKSRASVPPKMPDNKNPHPTRK